VKVTISIETAPAFIAGLVREGVTFEARENGADVIIEFTGGY